MCAVRYVDNRAFLSADPVIRPVPWQVYMSETFYGDSLLLEDVGDEPLLGFRIDAAQRSITLRLNTHASQFRSSASANSLSFAISGFRSRAQSTSCSYCSTIGRSDPVVRSTWSSSSYVVAYTCQVVETVQAIQRVASSCCAFDYRCVTGGHATGHFSLALRLLPRELWDQLLVIYVDLSLA